MNSANRNFAGLVVVSTVIAMLALCLGVGCVLAVLLVAEIASNGLAAGPGAVLPAIGFIAVVVTGAALGVASLRLQVRASRSLAHRVDAMKLPLSGELHQAAHRAGLTGRVELVDSEERFSFAYGAFTPRVALSRGLVEAAAPRELDAVLMHERYHVRNLDPLKVLLSRALPRSFPYVPALTSLHSRYLAGRELAADRRAVEEYGREPLAGALYKVLRGPAWPELSAAAAIGGTDLLQARLAQLEHGSEPPLERPSFGAFVLSILGVSALAILFAIAIAGFGGRSAISNLTGGGPTAIEATGAVLCVIPLVLGTGLGIRWLAARTRKPLDTDGP